MRFSLCIETQQGSSYEEILALALAAERHGFDGVYCSDHYLRMPAKAAPAGGLPGPTDAWTTLAGLARDTTSIRLGTLLTCATFRLPVPLAITVAQVDTMSRGRVVFGLGAGWVDLEHLVQGIAFPPVVERFDRLEEQLAIISGFWTTPVGSSFSYCGRYYRVVDSPALPKPVQLPTPPIVIGGSGRRRTPLLAAHFATEYNAPFLSMSRAVDQFDHVRRACEAVTRDPASLALSAGLIACCGSKPAEVTSRAARAGIDIASDGVVSGTPDEMAEVLLSWQAAGADHVYLEVLVSDLDHVELIGESVLPSLR